MLQNFYRWRVGGCWYNFCQCPNALYGRVQKTWYLKVEEKVRGILMKLWKIFVDAVVLNNGILSASIIKYWRMEREKVPMGF